MTGIDLFTRAGFLVVYQAVLFLLHLEEREFFKCQRAEEVATRAVLPRTERLVEKYANTP
jgi:hypothetical protein